MSCSKNENETVTEGKKKAWNSAVPLVFGSIASEPRYSEGPNKLVIEGTGVYSTQM